MFARRRLGRIIAVVLVLLTGAVAGNWSTIRAKYAGHLLRSAAPESQLGHAKSLLAIGPAGHAELVNGLNSSDASTCAAIASALNEQLAQMPPASDNFVQLARRFLDSFSAYSDPGQEAILAVLPMMLKSSESGLTEHCRNAIERGLKSSSRAKAMAANLASRPGVNLLPAALPLLNDPDAEVRAAVLKAIGTTSDATLVNDEELFRWLNDPDEKVRTVCEAVLELRGRSQDEIDLGRQLMHPNPRVRLQLLVDLPMEPMRDIGPWLERLSRDREPAVRAGAVRVASEQKLLYAEWAERLSVGDPDATVRQVASFHRRRAAGLTTAGAVGP